MRIVVLDGYTLNPGDLSWEQLESVGGLTVHDRTPDDLIVERALDAEILFTNKTPLTGATMDALPALRYIGVLATGYNVVDVQAAKRRSIPVTNVPSYGTESVAQMVFAHVLEITRNVRHHSDAVRQGRWAAAEDFCFWDTPQMELTGKIMGIVGFGRIGRAVGRVAVAMGMTVVAHDTQPGDAPDWTGFRRLGLEDLLRESDVVSLNCPLFPETRGMIDARALALMKRTAILINAARGPLVVDRDLADALNAGSIAGAGLDVLSEEPPGPDNPLLTAKNCRITPHIAWATREARARLMDTAVRNLQAFLDGTPQNVVNP
jgi:glycerate dehydrogenase